MYTVLLSGQLWAVGIPNGSGEESDWNDWMRDLPEDTLHTKCVATLCRDTVSNSRYGSSFAFCRGGGEKNGWRSSLLNKSVAKGDTGFRPILIPLNENLEVDLHSPYLCGQDGTVYQFGCLLMGDDIVQPPDIDESGRYCSLKKYDEESGISLTDYCEPYVEKSNQIQWVKYKDRLISDRVLLANVAWETLEFFGFTELLPE